MRKIKKSETYLFICTLAVCLISFFIITADSVLTVHDDILTYMQVLRGNLLQTAVDDARHGRIGHIPLTLLLYIPYFFRSIPAARAFSVLSVMFDMTALYCLVRTAADKYAASLSSVLFISFACISNQHNLFVSYTVGHQIPSGLVLFSLNEFLKYYTSDRKKRRLYISALLLVTASVLYEACAAYILMYILTALYFNKGKILKTISDTVPHFLCLALYIAVYFIWRKSYPSDYDGSVLSFSDIPQSLVTMLKYSFGMIPGLPAAAMYLKKYITAGELKSQLSVLMLTAPVLTGILFYVIYPKIKKCENRGLIIISVISGIFIPNIIISFTPKYTEWAAGNSYSYVTSFYSYFFLITLFIIILKNIFRKENKAVRLILSTAVFIISSVCTVNNTAWNCYFDKQLDRYSAFSDAVSSEYFSSLEDGTIVYIPEYTGIHNDMSITESFVSIYTESDLTFTNDESDIDFTCPAVIMKYDYSTGKISCGKLNEDFTFDTEYIS